MAINWEQAWSLIDAAIDKREQELAEVPPWEEQKKIIEQVVDAYLVGHAVWSHEELLALSRKNMGGDVSEMLD